MKLTDNCVLVDWDVSWFLILESIKIGNHCFASVQTFQIDGLNRLKTVKIKNNSFSKDKYWYGDDESKSFHILNCESLESIQIDEWSFSDFGGEFDLKNLPQLQSIQIGTVESDSSKFYHSSFVVRGIKLIKLSYVDLPNVHTIILGLSTFSRSESAKFESLKYLPIL